MPGEKIAEYVERFSKTYKAVKAVCTRNLSEGNTVQEPIYDKETTVEEHRTTDRDKEDEKGYPLEGMNWEDIGQNERQNRVPEDSTMRQQEATIIKRARRSKKN